MMLTTSDKFGGELPGQPHDISWFARMLLIALANSAGGATRGGKRLSAILVLAAATSCFIGNLMYFISHHWFDVIGWMRDLWPWQSENIRSLKNPGMAFVLMVTIPAGLVWWRVSLDCRAWIRGARTQSGHYILYGMWGMLQTFGSVLVAVKFNHPIIALAMQTFAAVLLVQWYRYHPSHSNRVY